MSPMRLVRKANGWKLIAAAVLAGVLLVVVFFVRAQVAAVRDVKLCEKIDRFVVVIEQSVRASPTLTKTQKNERIKFYEDLRNDPPVCRTTPKEVP